MVIQLILSGGGDAQQSKNLDKFFVSLLDKNKPLLYIPIAMKYKRNLSACLDWLKSSLNSLRVDKIVMWENVTNKKLEDLAKFSGIYVGGGNTFSLLKDMKESKFLDILRKYIQSGGIVYGGSAGAIMLGKDVITAKDENIVNLKDTASLDFIKGYSIVCHYFPDKHQDFVKALLKKGLKIIALTEGSGIYVHKDKIFTKGIGKVYVFNKNKSKTFGTGRLIE